MGEMANTYKETMDKIGKQKEMIKHLEEQNAILQNKNKAAGEIFELLHDIETCIRFVDKVKAFDTIMELYSESQEVYGVE